VDKQKQQQEELRTSNAATGHVMSDSSSSPVEPLPASKAKPKAAPKAKAAPKICRRMWANIQAVALCFNFAADAKV
jgi:hypothetical protein